MAVVALLLVLIAAPSVAQPAPFDSLAVVTAAQRHVDTLASRTMMGRGYLHGGHERAAAYLTDRFEELGLQPVGGSYEQPFEIEIGTFPEEPELSVDGRALRLGYEYLPSRASASGVVSGRVVDVGAGLGLARPGDARLPHESLHGTVAVLRERVPPDARRDAEVPEQALTLAARLQAVEQAGAAAAVVRGDLAFGASFYDAGIPVLQVEEDMWPAFATDVSLAVRHDRDERFTTQNLVGLVEGTRRPHDIVLVMAHYDHLGAIGDSLYFPGANDNASGVALMLELANYFSEHPPPFSVLFVAFSGEEVGLLGARHFVEEPPVDLRRVRFVLNFDMVASGEDGVMAVAGSDFPDAFDHLASVNDTLDSRPLSRRPNAPNSDHFFLIHGGVPGFYLYTKDGVQPYHSVEDVPNTLEWDDWWHVYRLARTFLETME